jgi:hypothetical protein
MILQSNLSCQANTMGLTVVEEERKVRVGHSFVNVHVPAHHHGALAPQLKRAGLQALGNL